MKIITKIICLCCFLTIAIIACKKDEPQNNSSSTPSGLIYNPDSIEVVFGTIGTSAKPAYKGNDVTFTFTSTPDAQGKITINNKTGIISTAADLPKGAYTIDVVLTNAVGSYTANHALYISVIDQAAASPPSALLYAPNEITIIAGTQGQSPQPSIKGTNPIQYSITTISPQPAAGAITIDATTGKITSSATVPVGIYAITVKASNIVGDIEIPDIFTFNVQAPPSGPPSELTYTPNTLSVAQGASASSAVPTMKGKAATKFEFVGVVDASFKINATTGVISVTTTSALVASYKLTVKVTNPDGNTTFPDVFTVNVTPSNAKVTYYADIVPILTVCGNCHPGSGPKSFGKNDATGYNDTKANIDLVLSRVTKQPGTAGFMPQSGAPLTAAEIQLLQQWKTDGLLDQ